VQTTTSTTANLHDASSTSPVRRWVALALLCVGQLMLILDITVVNVALPDISADLHLSGATVPWVVAGYTVAFGGLMLFGGRLADFVGPRRIVLAGLALFTTASLMTGLASGPAILLAGRVGQGVGAALLSPAALSVISTTFHGSERTKALGVWAAVAGAGSALGVILGGVLTSIAGWRWVFFINVPIGVALLVALARFVPVPSSRNGRDQVGVLGATTVTAATALAMYGLINAGSHGWAATSTLLPIGAGVLLYALFFAAQRATASPLMDVRLLVRRSVAAGSILMLVATGLLVGGFFLGSFYLQHARGYSALHTGVVFLPVAIATILGAHHAGHAVAHFGGRTVAPAGLGLAALGAAIAAYWPNPTVLVVGLSVAALGIGATFVTAITSALADVEPHESGLRSGIVNTFHELGGAIGVAVLSSVAAASLGATHPATGGFTRAFTVSAAAAAGAALLALFIVPAGKPAAGTAPHLH
jgi:EmrB/QacA subfamily drug resistance transporter